MGLAGLDGVAGVAQSILPLGTSRPLAPPGRKRVSKVAEKGTLEKRKPATHSSSGHFYAGVPTGIRTVKDLGC